MLEIEIKDIMALAANMPESEPDAENKAEFPVGTYELPVYCRPGEMFGIESKGTLLDSIFLLARMPSVEGKDYVTLVSLSSGLRWDAVVEVKDHQAITREEMSRLIPQNSNPKQIVPLNVALLRNELKAYRYTIKKPDDDDDSDLPF